MARHRFSPIVLLPVLLILALLAAWWVWLQPPPSDVPVAQANRPDRPVAPAGVEPSQEPAPPVMDPPHETGDGVDPLPSAGQAPAALEETDAPGQREAGPSDSLDWIRDHQAADGLWGGVPLNVTGAANGRIYGTAPGAGDAGDRHMRAAITGLAMLAFLGAGSTHTDGDYADALARALEALTRLQRENGAFGDPAAPDGLLGHAIATAAVCEAYGMTGAPELQETAANAVGFAVASQVRREPDAATGEDPEVTGYGWGSTFPAFDPEPMTTAWMLMAWKTARVCGLAPDRTAMDGAMRYLNGQFSSDEAVDAAVLLGQAFSGGRIDHADPDVQSRLQRLEAVMASPDRFGDPLRRWLVLLVLFQVSEPGRWAELLEKAEAAMPAGPVAGVPGSGLFGSWEPDGAMDRSFGRVGSTALRLLDQQMRFRYQQLATGG